MGQLTKAHCRKAGTRLHQTSGWDNENRVLEWCLGQHLSPKQTAWVVQGFNQSRERAKRRKEQQR